MPDTITIRLIEEDDMQALLDAERAANAVRVADPDFGQVEWLNPWCLSAQDVLDIIRQYPRRDHGICDTRTLVTEILTKGQDPDGETYEIPLVCGGFSYEVQDDGFELLFAIVHPAAPVADVWKTVLAYLKRRAERSAKRKKVTVYLRDRDEAGLRQLLPLVRAEGFSVRLQPNYFGNHDGWECAFRDTEEE